MKTQFATLTLAVLGGLGAMVVPGVSQAANVGYYGMCYGGTPVQQITTAGQTPVALASAPNTANLAGISLLWAESCGDLSDPGVATAVFNGMALIVHTRDNGSNGSYLPGNPNLGRIASYGTDINFSAGTPFLNGPGGSLNNSSLDNGNWSNHGAFTLASLPAGSSVYATTANANEVVTFGYPYGAGRVIFSSIPLQCYLPGGNCVSIQPTAQGMQTYATNLIAWAVTGGPTTTCASEGYTGTQLNWCVKICESGLTGKDLDVWLQRWIRQFRKLPYCALPT
ncbi:MAG: hypothetical protein KGL71_12185 [Xanthomonadaceae bacterium]|nr:hypothetical protein [Xanthomonadaceae bacterium]